MIPQEKTESVERALRTAFGVTAAEAIEPLTRGNNITSLVFRIVVQGSAYLLKVSMRAIDPTRHYSCMAAAADAGLAPRVRYANVDDGISITDFVETVPFTAAEALLRMPGVLRTLHALPPFSGVPDHLNTTCTFLTNLGPATTGFLEKFQAANILPEAETAQFLDFHAQFSSAYP